MIGSAVRLHGGAVGDAIDRVEAAFAAATSMAFRRSSTTRGRPPDWLRDATRFELAGVVRDGPEAAVVRLRVPRLGDAARQLYSQPSLFGDDLPDGDATGLDLLGDTIHEVRDRNSDDDHVDLNMLRTLRLFGPSLDRGVDAVELEVEEHANVDRELVTISKELSSKTPPDRRVRVMGRLDMLCYSDSLFRLIVPSGEIVRGIWIPGDVPELGPMLRSDVVVDAKAVFRPSGQLLRLDADAMEPATAADSFFGRLPKPGRIADQSLVHRVSQLQTATTGVGALYGAWPGDESEEELLASLAEMRGR